MSKRISAWLLTFVLVLALAPLPASAASIEEQLNGWNGGGSGQLSAQRSGNTVTVAGTVSNASQTLTLDIPQGLTVSWGASLNFWGASSAITVSGAGIFEVTNNARIIAAGASNLSAINSSGGNIVINGGNISVAGASNLRTINSSGGNVTVNGGSISAAGARDIRAIYSSNSIIIVSGGTISAAGSAGIRGILGTNNSSVTVADNAVVNAEGWSDRMTVEVIGGDIVTTATASVTAPNLHTASSWAHNEINSAVAAGLVPQNLQNHYTNNITRAEFTALAVLLYETVTGREITGRVTFNDTTDINVQKAAYISIVSGTGGGYFSPNMQFNREQAAVLIMRLFWAIHDYLGTDLPAMFDMPYLPSVFADYRQISPWASGGVASAYVLGIMGGVGNSHFDPQGTFTREHSIITVWRLFDSID